MKLLHCKNCGDVVALRFTDRHCWCGKSSGRYLPGAKGSAVYSGECRILGINNYDMRDSMRVATRLDEHGNSTPRWEWFVILEGRNILKLGKK